jgi:hypothetical protein
LQAGGQGFDSLCLHHAHVSVSRAPGNGCLPIGIDQFIGPVDKKRTCTLKTAYRMTKNKTKRRRKRKVLQVTKVHKNTRVTKQVLEKDLHQSVLDFTTKDREP